MSDPGTDVGVGAPSVSVPLARLDPGVQPPRYAHPGDAGADLSSVEDFVLRPGERRVVGTGVAIAVPEGYAAFVHPRSGLAARYGVTVVNAPGTVDAGYRGEVRVCLINTDPVEPVSFARGDRIAQLVIQPVVRARFESVPQLPDSARGAGGYGSTGGIPSSPQAGTGAVTMSNATAAPLPLPTAVAGAPESEA